MLLIEVFLKLWELIEIPLFLPQAFTGIAELSSTTSSSTVTTKARRATAIAANKLNVKLLCTKSGRARSLRLQRPGTVVSDEQRHTLTASFCGNIQLPYTFQPAEEQWKTAGILYPHSCCHMAKSRLASCTSNTISEQYTLLSFVVITKWTSCTKTMVRNLFLIQEVSRYPPLSLWMSASCGRAS